MPVGVTSVLQRLVLLGLLVLVTVPSVVGTASTRSNDSKRHVTRIASTRLQRLRQALARGVHREDESADPPRWRPVRTLLAHATRARPRIFLTAGLLKAGSRPDSARAP